MCLHVSLRRSECKTVGCFVFNGLDIEDHGGETIKDHGAEIHPGGQQLIVNFTYCEVWIAL